MRLENLPFTVYDVVGYLVPGYFAIWCFAAFSPEFIQLNIRVESVLNFENDLLNGGSTIVMLLIVSYALGHLIGFLSSITVEKFANHYTDYPSRYLIEAYRFRGPIRDNTVVRNAARDWHKFRLLAVHLLMVSVIIPLWVMILSGWFSALIKPLPQNILSQLSSKYEQITQRVGSLKADDNWFKFVEYYVINNQPSALARMYNYVTIYGFLRNACFVSCCMANILLLDAFFEIKPNSGSHMPRFAFEIRIFLASVVMSFLSFGFLLAFIKFYRRYSEEGVLAFVTYKTVKDS